MTMLGYHVMIVVGYHVMIVLGSSASFEVNLSTNINHVERP